MPTTINGIGTHYYGKKNKESEEGICDFCQRDAILSDYETRTWFVFIFIPIIPLGKKKILNHCSKCRQHMAMPLSEWEDLEERELSSGIEKLSQNSNDPKVALEVFGTLLGFSKKEEARDLADSMEEKFPDDIDVQITVGSWHEKEKRMVEADRCFQRAYDSDPEDPRSIRAIGITKLQNGHVEEAKELLDKLSHPSPGYDPAIFFNLASKYQELDDHPAALEEFKKLGTTHPELPHDKNYRFLVKKSENALGTTESILPKKSVFSSKLFWWTAAAAILIAGLGFYNFNISQSQTVHIVNGLKTPISVLIDENTKVTVPSLSRKEITLPEGQHKVSVQEPAALKTEYNFDIQSSYFGRFVNRPAFVLDPTQTSYFYWEKMYYRERPVDGEYESEDFIGRKFLSLKHVDYPFTNFPEEIDLGKSNLVTKTGLTFESETLPSETIYSSDNAPVSKDQIAYGENHLKMTPENSMLLRSLYYFCEETNNQAKADEILKIYCEVRPILIESHELKRQVSNQEQIANLRKQYDEELKSSPNDSKLLYLRGRLEKRFSISQPFIQKAIKANPKNAYALNQKAIQLAAMGELKEAMRAKMAAEKISDRFYDYTYKYHTGGRNFDYILSDINEKLKDYQENVFALQLLLKAYCNQGNLQKAKQTLDRINTLANKNKEILQYWISHAHSAELDYYYAFNQCQNCFELASKNKIPRYKTIIEIETGKSIDSKVIEEMFYGDERIVAFLASALSNPKLKETNIKKAIELLEDDGMDKTFLAEVLKTSLSTEVKWNDLEELILSPKLKAVTLTLLKEKVKEEDHAKLDRMVIQLNYLKEFPHNLVTSKIMNRPLFTNSTPFKVFKMKTQSDTIAPKALPGTKGSMSGGANQFRNNIPSESD